MKFLWNLLLPTFDLNETMLSWFPNRQQSFRACHRIRSHCVPFLKIFFLLTVRSNHLKQINNELPSHLHHWAERREIGITLRNKKKLFRKTNLPGALKFSHLVYSLHQSFVQWVRKSSKLFDPFSARSRNIVELSSVQFSVNICMFRFLSVSLAPHPRPIGNAIRFTKLYFNLASLARADRLKLQM